MTDSAMAKVIPFPTERTSRPVPSCEVCGAYYEVEQIEQTRLVRVYHSCDLVPFDERIVSQEEYLHATAS